MGNDAAENHTAPDRRSGRVPHTRRAPVRYVRLDDGRAEAGTTRKADALATKKAGAGKRAGDARMRGVCIEAEAVATVPVRRKNVRIDGYDSRRKAGIHQLKVDRIRSSIFREGWYDSKAYANQVARESMIVETYRAEIESMMVYSIDEAFELACELPIDVSRACLAQPRHNDPLWPLAERLRLFLGTLSLDLIGALYGLTRERIRQIEAQGLARCVDPMGGWRDHAETDTETTWPECWV